MTKRLRQAAGGRINRAQTAAEVLALRSGLARWKPQDPQTWQRRIAGLISLECTLCPGGRPRKGREKVI